MRLASVPTANGRPSLTLTATTEGSFSTIPRPRTYTRVLAVPRSTAISRPNREKRLSRIRDATLRGGSGGTACLAEPHMHSAVFAEQSTRDLSPTLREPSHRHKDDLTPGLHRIKDQVRRA